LAYLYWENWQPRTSLLAVLLLLSAQIRADSWHEELGAAAASAGKLSQARIDSKITPKAAEQLRQQQNAAVKQIETIADKYSTVPAAQLAVGRSLASINEAAQALVYVERGLALAKTSSDRKLIREALLTGAMVYEKAELYDLSREKAQLALKNDPNDNEAFAAYMMVKDRVPPSKTTQALAPEFGHFTTPNSVPQPPQHANRSPRHISPPLNMTGADPSSLRAYTHYSANCTANDKYSCDAVQISNNCFDTSAKNTCVRDCLVAKDEECVRLDTAHMPGCRVKAHILCYISCRKYIPTIIEASCYTKLWGNLLRGSK
jgi:tetratricopeptide (TPR) repeat protein